MVGFSEIISFSDGSLDDLRRRVGLAPSDDLRVLYIPGPGDVVGTFNHWRAGRHEPRVPIIAYSLMFYELMDRLGAHSLTVSLQPFVDPPESLRGKFRFEEIVPSRARGRLSYFWGQRRFAKEIASIANRYDPHIVVASTHSPVGSWGRLSKGRKLVLTAHNTFWPQGRPPRGIKGRLRMALLTSHARALDAAICTSHECARQIALLTNGRVQGEVANPQVVARYPIEQREKVRNLLFLGRIERTKGVFLLFDVFESIADRYSGLTLTFAGDGDADQELRERLLLSRFANRVSFLGRIDSQGVHAAIAASDLVVCPTMTGFNEGLAVVGFEAAAHGIPALLSSVVPAAELLGESCSVYEADNPGALENVLCELIDDPQAYRAKCTATAEVRNIIYDRKLSWGSKLFSALIR